MILGGAKICEKGDNNVNVFGTDDKDSKYTYKPIYTFVSSNYEARTTFLFLACFFIELFYSYSKTRTSRSFKVSS